MPPTELDQSALQPDRNTIRPPRLECALTDALEEELEAGTQRSYFKPLVYKTEALGRHASYPVTLTGGDFRVDSPYFRVGKYLVLDPNLTLSDHDLPPDERFDAEAFLRRGMQLDEVIFLSDDRNPSYRYSEDLERDGYFLPNTAGCMLALHELGPELAGRTLVDVGSRNLLVANTGLREGAARCIAIEPERENAYCFKSELFGIDLEEQCVGDRMILNAQFNRTADRISIRQCNLGRCEVQRVEGGIAVFNFPDYGRWYVDATPEERDAGAMRFSGGMILGYGNLEKKSLFEDVVRIFEGVDYVIASGGARCPARPEVIIDRSDWILEEADRLGFDLAQEIYVAEPKTGHFGGTDEIFDRGPVISVQVEFVTYIFRRQ